MNIEKKVEQTLKKIKINKKEKILIALSGGKDSAVVAFILKKLGYNIQGLHIDLGLGEYSKKCLKAVKELCKSLDIKLKVYDFKKQYGVSMCHIRSTIQSKQNLKNCAICGIIKKWILNKEARKIKSSKIATGHHLDDEAQTFLMNILKGAPQLSSNTGIITNNYKDKKFIPRIKPLFYVLEEDIKKFSKEKKLPIAKGSCPGAIDSYRIQIRKFFKKLSRKEKENIIQNFERLKPKIKKEKGKITYCEICKEPSRKRICKKCSLLNSSKSLNIS